MKGNKMHRRIIFSWIIEQIFRAFERIMQQIVYMQQDQWDSHIKIPHFYSLISGCRWNEFIAQINYRNIDDFYFFRRKITKLSHNSRFNIEHLPNCILCFTVSKGVIHKSCPKAADAPHAAAWEKWRVRERERTWG